MAELKYYNFNFSYVPLELPGPPSADFTPNHYVQRDFLGYFPLHRYGMQWGLDVNNDWSGVVTEAIKCVALNYKPLFFSDVILPSHQGVEEAQVVGDRFRWRSTMIDLTLNPQRFQELFKSPALNVMINAATTVNREQFGGALAPLTDNSISATYSKGFQGNNYIQYAGTQAGVAYPTLAIGSAGYSTSSTKHRYETMGLTQQEATDPAHSQDVVIQSSTVSPNPPYGITLARTEGDDMNVGLATIDPPVMTPSRKVYFDYFPLYRMPNYRPFFYCRLVVFKFRFSQTDWATFRSAQRLQNDFLNSIWWNRFDSSGHPNMSVRTNDFNVNTPTGGLFDLKYNKLLQINPLKNYKFRINLYSTSRRGDNVEIRRNDIFAAVSEDEKKYPYYKNALYGAFLLPPLDVQSDFDAVSSLLISAGSFFDTANYPAYQDYNQKINPQYVYGPYNPFSVPLSIETVSVPRGETTLVRHGPAFLPLCTTRITGRTAYYD